MTDKTKVWLWLSILLCASACIYSLAFRYRAESRNRAVSLVAEADQIESLSTVEGVNLELALGRLKSAGLTGLVISEDTVGDLVSSGEVRLETSLLARSQSPVVKIIGDPESVSRIERGIRNRFELGATQIGIDADLGDGSSNVALTVLNLSPTLLRSVSIGLDSHYSRAASFAGLEVVGRHANPVGATDRYVQETIRWSRESGSKFFLPTGDQVLGRRDSLAAFVAALESNDLAYCSPEFAKIGGDANVLAKAPELVVRLHAAQSVEIDKLTPGGYLERYAKAASERNIRMLLLRPLDFSSVTPFDSFSTLVATVARQVRKEGMDVRSAHPFADSSPPRWIFVAVGLTLVPSAIFVVSAFFGGRRWVVGTSAVLLAALGASCYFEPMRSYAALVGSTSLPVASMILVPRLRLPIAIQFFVVCLASLVGGLSVAALLNGLPYFIRADQFSGVKIAVFMPIALVGGYWFNQLAEARTAVQRPMVWSQAILGIVLLALLAFMATRTGNDNPAGVSGFELKLRSLLENWLVVRPRTKEFLIGHPSLVVALGMLSNCISSDSFRAKWGGWTALAMLAAAIGQTSMVNTLCHLHTPLSIGLLRTAIGVAIGGIAGGAIWIVLKFTVFRHELSSREAHAG